MLIELVTLGRDGELKATQSGTSLLSFAAAYDIGFGQNKKTQWIDCVIFGKKAESLVDHLKKGKQIQISARDVHIQTWNKSDGSGQGFKLCCTVDDVKFCRDGTGGQQPQQGGYNQAPQQPAGNASAQYQPANANAQQTAGYHSNQRPAPPPQGQPQGAYQQPQRTAQPSNHDYGGFDDEFQG